MGMGDHFRAYRLRCYPTRTQRAQLARMFGASRWVWNRALDAVSRAHQDPELTAMFGRGLSFSCYDFGRLLTQVRREPEFGWLATIDTGVLTQTLRDLRRAYSNFFDRRACYPRHKRRNHTQKIRLHFHNHHPGKMRAWREQRLILPQLGELAVVWSRRPSSAPKMVGVSRDGAGRYWVSMAVKEGIPPLAANEIGVGVDVGVKDLAVLSDGTRIRNPRKLAGKLRHLKRLSRSLSRRTKGSGRWRRQRQRIARLHCRIADTRRSTLHQVSSSIVRSAGVIAIETLSVAPMMRNPILARSVADASIAELHRQLDYKARWYGRTLVKLGRFEPSSRLCSTAGCGHQNLNLTLKHRSWRCPSCGAVHDRDLNAARNILAGGLRLIAESGVGQGVPELKRVEGVRPPGCRHASAGRGRPVKREPDRPARRTTCRRS